MNKTLLLTALVATSALAQDAAQPPPPPAPAPVANAPADAPMEDQGGRVRWGVSANIGWHIPSMFTIGGEGRIGYVFSNLFNAYLIGGGVGGFGFGGSVNSGGTGGSVSVSAVSYWYLGAIAELMFGNIFYVGGGPVLASGGFATVGLAASNTAGAISTVTHSGFAPGLDLRLGLGFGGQKGPPSFRRGGFNLGLSVLTLFRPGSVVTRLEGGTGGGSATVTTNELFVTAAPMLTLGYDAR